MFETPSGSLPGIPPAVLGSAWAFVLALAIIVVWAITGPTFGFSDTWQLIINTGTTIVTFLMVFLIQNTQNRDAKAVHLKLDELIRALGPARNKLVDLEKLSDDDLKKLEKEFAKDPKESGRREGRGRGTQERRFAVTGSAVSSGRASPLRIKTFPLGTKPQDFAVMAIRAPRETAPPPVPDEPVAPVRPVLARHELHQVAFDLFRIGVAG